jgi:hypothetical protein
MHPIREELGLVPPAAPIAEPEPTSPVPEPPPLPEEVPGMLRRILRRWRGPDDSGAGRTA